MNAYLVNTEDFPVLWTHMFTSKKLLEGFEHLGYKTKTITNFDEVSDDNNIFILSNHCFIHQKEDDLIIKLEIIANKYPNSVFILWFFHKFAAQNKIPFKKWILTGECFYEKPATNEHLWYYNFQNTLDNYVPWRFAVASSVQDIFMDLERIKNECLQDVKYNACFIGSSYKPDCTQHIKNICYHSNSEGFLDEEERINIMKSSLISLGWHNDNNIANNVVVERIFESMRYGCIVVTDNPIAEKITNGICEYVRNYDEVNAKIEYYLANPVERKNKIISGLKWLIQNGTYSHVAMDFVKKIQSFSTQKVLVTGGCGFVGRHFITKYLSNGYQVDCIDNLASLGSLHPSEWCQNKSNFTFIESDCRKFFTKPLKKHYDIVLHLAAIVGGRANIENDPMSVADDLSIDTSMFVWAVKNKDKIGNIIYFSSSAAYPIKYQQNDNQKMKLSEKMIDFESNRIGMPDLTYGWTKLTGEYLAKLAVNHYGMRVACYRPFSGYGEDQDETYPFIGILKRVLNKENPVVIWNDSIRDFVHIDDIVDYVCKTYLLVSDGNGVNIGSGVEISFKELTHKMMQICEHNADIQILNDKPKGVHYRVANKDSKINLHQNISLEEGIIKAKQYLISKIPEISLCIPTHSRYETFLKDNLPKFIESPYIKEIIIVDDATDDYEKLFNEYGLTHHKIRLYKQNQNVGSFKNKVKAASLATCEWICLLDSDNFADDRYFKPLLNEWKQNGADKNIIYTPTKALPLNILKDSDLPSKMVTKREWNSIVPKTWFLNLGNFVFHKSFVPFLNIPKYHEYNCYGLCSIYINWIAIKHNFIIKFVDDMTYDHAVHPQSTYALTCTESDRFNHTFDWVV